MNTLLQHWERLKDNTLRFIEVKAGRIYNWAWDKRWKERDSEEWKRGYTEWKKRKCPHN